MDEYLFIAQAKLKADLGLLERPRPGQRDSKPAESVALPPAHSPRARRAASIPNDVLAVVSTHGLRGWS